MTTNAAGAQGQGIEMAQALGAAQAPHRSPRATATVAITATGERSIRPAPLPRAKKNAMKSTATTACNSSPVFRDRIQQRVGPESRPERICRVLRQENRSRAPATLCNPADELLQRAQAYWISTAFSWWLTKSRWAFGALASCGRSNTSTSNPTSRVRQGITNAASTRWASSQAREELINPKVFPPGSTAYLRLQPAGYCGGHGNVQDDQRKSTMARWSWPRASTPSTARKICSATDHR